MKYLYMLLLIFLISFQLKANEKGLKKSENLGTEKNYKYEYFRDGKKIFMVCKRDFSILQFIFFQEKIFILFSKVKEFESISIITLDINIENYPSLIFTKKKGVIHTIRILNKDTNIIEAYNVKNGIIEPMLDKELKQLQYDF